MVVFSATVDAAAPAQAVWDLVTDWPQHARFVPLTKVERLPGPVGGLGERFWTRSGVGRLGFDDPMEVVVWQPPADGAPGRCRLSKLGRVVLGRADIEVVPTSSTSCRVVWTEDVQVVPAGLTRLADPLLRRAGAAAFGRVLRAMVDEVERGRT